MITRAAKEVGDKDADVQPEPNHSDRLVDKLKSKKYLTAAVAGITLMLLCYGLFQFFEAKQRENRVEVSGRIEADETHILAATGTRVTSINVKEGDVVHKGELVVTLDSQNLEGKIGSGRKVLNQARSAQKHAAVEVRTAQQNINEARKKSKGLFAKIFSTPKGRAKKAAELRSDMIQAKMMSFQAQATAAQADAAISQAASKISYFKLTSPIDGIVSVRSAEVGEIVGAGQVLLTIVDPKSAYMRGFISEGDLAKISIGQKAEVSLGSDDVKPLNGRVVSIDPKASFTPQNVYFKNDRLRQSFGLKIALENENGVAKPGMRADARIFLKSPSEE